MDQTILSVDGDSASRSRRGEVFRRAGFTIMEAATGTDALKLAVESQLTLIVLAIEVPGTDGLSVVEQLKADSRTTLIPVLHISSHGDSHRRYSESLASGADAYLEEPIEPEVLVNVAAALIRNGSSRTGARQFELDTFAKDTLPALIESIPDEIWFADAEGRFTLANPAALREFNLGAATAEVGELTRRLEVYRADGSPRPPEEAPALRALAGETIRDQEEIVRTPAHGELRHRQVSASPVRDASGKIVGSVSVVHDITERKRAEQALRASEERLRLFVEHAPAAIAMFDRQMRYVAVSRRWVTDLLSGEQDLIGRCHYDVFPEISERWKEIHRRCLDGAIERCDEDIFPRGDGRVDWLRWEIRPWRNGANEIEGIVIFTEQITERKLALEALARTESRFRALLDSASQGVVAIDGSGRIVLANTKTEELFGYVRDELLGQLMEILVPERYRAAHAGHLQDYFKHPRTRPMGLGIELAGRRKDGTEFPLEVSLSSIEQGGSRLSMALITDITERKKAEARLLDSQKLESLGLLAGGVAHDFNNLLVGVIGNASLAQDLLPANHAAAQLLEGVLKAGEQAAHLTRQMLAYSGKGKFAVEALDLSTLIPDMSGLVRPSLPKKVAVRFDLDPDLPAVEADRGQVQQVFMNLVLNAAEAIGSHEGLITIRTRVQDADEQFMQRHSETTALAPGKYVCLEVSDSGCGMDEATRLRIFDPFFSTKFIGRGLGLAAVAGIVRGHKGAVTVTSTPGKGTCFTVLLPAVARAAGEASFALRDAKLKGTGVILVVDDELMVREMLKKALERHGYTVLLADGGVAAVDIVRRHPGEIALVVLDMSMPVMSGEETLPELRRIRPKIKVLVSSGYGESEAMTLFRGQQVSGFIQKPFTIKGIAQKVKSCLE